MPRGRWPSSARCGHRFPASRAGGASLVECLVAILIFSIGVLGIVGLQGRSIADAGENNYRAQAALLGGQIIGRMRLDPAALSTYALNGTATPGNCAAGSNASSNTVVTDWLSQVGSALPAATALAQQVNVNGTGQVAVTLCWKSPREARVHNFVIRGQVP